MTIFPLDFDCFHRWLFNGVGPKRNLISLRSLQFDDALDDVDDANVTLSSRARIRAYIVQKYVLKVLLVNSFQEH